MIHLTAGSTSWKKNIAVVARTRPRYCKMYCLQQGRNVKLCFICSSEIKLSTEERVRDSGAATCGAGAGTGEIGSRGNRNNTNE